jgi:cytoskeletal protein CcmA (bactofilin family)
MSDIPRRRLLDRIGSSPSLLAPGARLIGDIQTQGPFLLSGHIRGNGHIGGELSIGAQAHWEGDLVAQRAVVAGRITGSIQVEGHIEIGASAVIHGRVSARRVAIAYGAQVEGEITVVDGGDIVEFEEKRTVPL